MSVDAFRKLYREPLRRTRNQTITRFDLSRRGARASPTKITADRAREMGRRGALARRAAMTDDEKRVFAILGGKARARAGDLTRAAAAARTARFAAMTPEERRAAMAPLERARNARRVARWPFPDGPRVPRAVSLERARAALRAKLARTKLARIAAKKKARSLGP